MMLQKPEAEGTQEEKRRRQHIMMNKDIFGDWRLQRPEGQVPSVPRHEYFNGQRSAAIRTSEEPDEEKWGKEFRKVHN